MRAFVITGGPGSGKSTLLDALQRRGFNVVPEVSRTLIREQVLAGSDCLPWLDLGAFAAVCLDKMVADFRSAAAGSVTFFDRGIPDIAAYLRAGGLETGAQLLGALQQCRYEQTVFVAPPWKEIYVNDDERWQTFEESCALYSSVYQLYSEEGYQLVELPRVPVEQRAEFVIKTINQ